MKKIMIILMILPVLLVVSYAEPIEFSGSASIYSEYNPIHGAAQERPTSTLRFNLNPTITIYGMPLSLNLFLSSEESNLRQALNKFSISIQPKDLMRDMVHLPSFIFSISEVEIGTCYPQYSPYTLSGTPVTGGTVELNPWFLYFSFAAGRIQRAVEGSDTTNPAYARKLYSGRFGIGKRDGTHLFFTYLYAGDDSTSIYPYTFPTTGDSDTVEVITPQENYLVGVEFTLILFEDRFTLESEIVGSQLTRDVRMPELVIPGAPSWVEGIFHPRMSSSFDYAYSVKPSLTMFDTRMWGGLKMVGPGYTSLGAPNLRNDNFAYEVGMKKNLLNNSISLCVSHTNEHDNLIGNKVSTTSFTSYAFNIGLNFINFPYLYVGYTPYYQSNDSLSIDNQTDILFLSTGYNFTLFDLNNSSTFSYSHQTYQEEFDVNNYSSNSFSLYESVDFKFPLSISTGIGITNTAYTEKKAQIFSFDINTAYTFYQRWTSSLGFDISPEGKKGSRYGISSNSFLPMWFGNMNFRVAWNTYQGEYEEEDYEEWRFIGTISKNW